MRPVTKTLLIRADASVPRGTGHVMRCLAIAQAWKDAGGEVTYAMAESTSSVESRLDQEGIKIFSIQSTPGSAHDAESLVECALSQNADLLIVDGYHFGKEYCQALKVAGLKFLIIADHNTSVCESADLLLNPDVSDEQEVRSNYGPQTSLLLGPRYALLRREFTSWKFAVREPAEGLLKLLVTMGGSDPENLSLRIMNALQKCGLPDLEVVVLVGGSNPHFEKLDSAQKIPTPKFKLIKDANNVPQWMAWADVAVTAAGNSIWELMFMGCPVICCTRGPEDERLLARLAKCHAAMDIGPSSHTQLEERFLREFMILREHKLREVMAKNGRALVDGLGAMRVVEQLLAVKDHTQNKTQHTSGSIRS